MKNMKNTSTRELIQEARDTVEQARRSGDAFAIERLANAVEILIELIERKNK